ncbi:MAG TPA: radical SAM protein [Vicinamibacterales bacterium]|nr:radical SAM protein [Vicinamibacterales bacterium]
MRITPIALRRRAARLTRRIREARALARAFQWPHRPIVAQIIPTRRCNLSCAYCNEFDRSSAPVPITVLQERIDRLVDLGTGIITLSGGEPLLHPDVGEIVGHVRRRGVIATLITNGYLLTPAMIQRLNGAGLDSLQISIDNVAPDDVSKKSLDLLDRKLQMLAAHAMFDVTVNAVIGGGSAHPEDALIIGRRARALGFQSTVGIIHDDGGQLVPLTDREQRTLRETIRLDRSVFSFDRYNRFQETLAAGKPCGWHCRAGSRYLYVCEDGLVHYCSQQRGHPGIPLAAYTVDDLAREYSTVKSCAPYCTIGCVHRVAMIDELRESPVETLQAWFGTPGSVAGLPRPVRVLVRLLVTGPERRFVRRAARRLLKL